MFVRLGKGSFVTFRIFVSALLYIISPFHNCLLSSNTIGMIYNIVSMAFGKMGGHGSN